MKYIDSENRFLLVLMSLFLATISQPSFAAPVSESGPALKAFRVEAFEKVIVPNNMDSYMGGAVKLKTNPPEAVRINLGYRFIAENGSPISAVVGGIPYSIPAGSLFTRRKASGGRISELPASALILCQESVQRNLTQSLASAATLGLTQLAARYAENVQLCGIDSDLDGNIENLFLGGAKQPQDLEFTSIDPVPYTHKENYAVEGVTFVLYTVKRIWGTPVLTAAVERNGLRTNLSRLWFERDGKMVDQPIAIAIKKGSLPQEVKLGSAIISIKSYDDISGIVELEFTKFFDAEKINWYIEPQTIYISY